MKTDVCRIRIDPLLDVDWHPITAFGAAEQSRSDAAIRYDAYTFYLAVQSHSSAIPSAGCRDTDGNHLIGVSA
jgi:hypothetical protein